MENSYQQENENTEPKQKEVEFVTITAFEIKTKDNQWKEVKECVKIVQ